MLEVNQQRSSFPESYPRDRRLKPRTCVPVTVHLEVARWLLAWEMSDGQAMLSEPEAAERALQKLLERLSKMITPSGCRALLARAVHLARTDFQFFQGIEPAVTAGTYIEGLSKGAEGTDPAQVHRGLACLLGTLIELVALFIGDYLTGRLLREVWPDLPAPGPTRQGLTVE